MKSINANSAFCHRYRMPTSHLPEPVSASVPLFDHSIAIKSQKRTFPFSDFTGNASRKQCEIQRNATSKCSSLKRASVESQDESPVLCCQGNQIHMNGSDAESKDAGPVDDLTRSSYTHVSTASNSMCKNCKCLSQIVLNIPTDKLIENFNLFKCVISNIKGVSSGEEVDDRGSNHIASDCPKNSLINCQGTTKTLLVSGNQKPMVDHATQTENRNSTFFTVQNEDIYNMLGKGSHRAENKGTESTRWEKKLSSEIDHGANAAESSENCNHSKDQFKNIDTDTSFSDGDIYEGDNFTDEYTNVILPDIEDLASSIEITAENKAVSNLNSTLVNRRILPSKFEQFEKRIRNNLKVLEMTNETWKSHNMETKALDSFEQDLFDRTTEMTDEACSSDMRENNSNITNMEGNAMLMKENKKILGAKTKRKRKLKFTSIRRKRQCIERESVNLNTERNRIGSYFDKRNHNKNSNNVHGKHAREDKACKTYKRTVHIQNGGGSVSELGHSSRRSRRVMKKNSKYQYGYDRYFSEYKVTLRKGQLSQRKKYSNDTLNKGCSASHRGKSKVKTGRVKNRTLSKKDKNLLKVTDYEKSFLKSMRNIPVDAEERQPHHFQNSVPECNREIKEMVVENNEKNQVALKRKKNGKLFKKDLKKLRRKMVLQRCGEKNVKFASKNSANHRAKEKLQHCEALSDFIIGEENRKHSTKEDISCLDKDKNNGQVEWYSFKSVSDESTGNSSSKVLQNTCAHAFEAKVPTNSGCHKIQRSARNKSIQNNRRFRKRKGTGGLLCEKSNSSPDIYLNKTTKLQNYKKSIKHSCTKKQLTHCLVGTKKQEPNTSKKQYNQTRSTQLAARKVVIQDAKAINKTRKKISSKIQSNEQYIVKKLPHLKTYKCQSCNYVTRYSWCLKRHEGVHLMAKPVHCNICHISFKSSVLMKQWHTKQRVNHLKEAPMEKPCESEDNDNAFEIFRTMDCTERSFLGGEIEVCSFKKDIKDLKNQTQDENSSFHNAYKNTKLTDQAFLSKILSSSSRIAVNSEEALCENERTWNEKTNFDAVLYLDKIPDNIGSTVFVKGAEKTVELYKRNTSGEFTKTNLPEEDASLTVETLEIENMEDYCDEKGIQPPDLSESYLIPNTDDLVNRIEQNDADESRCMPNLICAREDVTDPFSLDDCYDGTDTNNQKQAGGHSDQAEGNDQNTNQPENLNKSQNDKAENKSGGEDRDKDDDKNNERKDDKMDSREVMLFSCLACTASFCQKPDLMKHLSKIHRLSNLCTLCYFENSKIQRFLNPVTLQRHKLRSHQKAMVMCVCGTLLVDDKMLATHLKKFKCNTKSVDNEQEEIFRGNCGKRSGNKLALSDHKMLKCRKRCDNQDMSVRYDKKTEATKTPDQTCCSMVNRTDVDPVPFDQEIRGLKNVPIAKSEISRREKVDSVSNENYREVQKTSTSTTSEEQVNDLNNNRGIETTFLADTEMNVDKITHAEEVCNDPALQKYLLVDLKFGQNVTKTDMESRSTCNTEQYTPVDTNEDGAQKDIQEEQESRIDHIEKETLRKDCTKTRTQDIEPGTLKFSPNCTSLIQVANNIVRTEDVSTRADINTNTITVFAEVYNDFDGNIDKESFKTPVTPLKEVDPREEQRDPSIKGVKIARMKYACQMKRHCMNPGMGGFPCRVCGRRFKRPYLYVHMKRAHHREEQPYFMFGPQM